MSEIQQCKAKEPQFCPYHGKTVMAQMMAEADNAMMTASGSVNYQKAEANRVAIRAQYNSTPEGIKELQERIKSAKDKGENPIKDQEELRKARLLLSARRNDKNIEKFLSLANDKITPQQVSKLFDGTNYIVSNNIPNRKTGYYEIFDRSLPYSKNNVIGTITDLKNKGFMITVKNSLENPDYLPETFASTDNNSGDIIAAKESLVSLRRNIEKNKAVYSHQRKLSGDIRRYGLKSNKFAVPVGESKIYHQVIYSTNGTPFATVETDERGNYVKGYGATGHDSSIPFSDPFEFRIWLRNNKDTFKLLPKYLQEA